MVVHEPGAWFDETLRSLATQDYSSLRHVFLVVGGEPAEAASPRSSSFDDVAVRIRSVLPDAFIRPIFGDPGFGPAANEVLRLVEGDGGLFLVCHDDIALSRSTVRALVAELMRSNAGIVGPKLVDWDDPRRLQHVGLGLDRFGEVDPIVDDGEFDQEQHDGVRDVFVLPSACLLVRADLFRTLGGFDPAIPFHGEDVDLCWRAHLTGARVLVVPDAQVRHRERLRQRRPDLSHRTLAARHRMRCIATLTGSSRLALRLLQVAVLTLVELVIGLFTGRAGEAWASLRALLGLVPRVGSILARRSAIRHQRVVPDREVLATQARGSARLNSFVRSRETATFVGADSTVRRWREVSFGPFLTWFLVLLGIIVGSRTLIRDGVPPVGEFLPFGSGPTGLWSSYLSGFDPRGFGGAASNPTEWAIASVLGLVVLGRMELLMTVSVVGSYVIGAVGAWRMLTVFPLGRARIVGLVVYVGSPLVPYALGIGDWTLLVWFAALPWMVHLTGRSVGLAAADPLADRSGDGDGMVDGVERVAGTELVRLAAAVVLVTAVAAAFVPPVVVVWPVVALSLALGTIAARGSFAVAGRFVAMGVVGGGGAFLLNLPWSASWSVRTVWSGADAAQPARDLVDVLSLTGNDGGLERLGAVLLVPLLVAVTVGRAWRLTWAVRGLVISVVFGGALLLAERDLVGFAIPDRSLLLVPIGLSWAVGAAALVEGTGTDVLERGFGWRQPLAVLANLAIVVGLVPGVVSIGDGAWGAPSTPLAELVATQFPVEPARGDHRVLYVGDPRLIPIPSTEYAPGISYAVADAGPLRFTDRSVRPTGPGDDAVVDALDLMAASSTLRVGRLLAPLGIRYVVVPETDGVFSTDDQPLPVAAGLVASLQNQLDIGAVYGIPSLQIFENLSWMPVAAVVSGPTAEASALAGDEALVRSDLSQATAVFPGFDAIEPAGSAVVEGGVVHLAVPFDDRIELRVDDVEVPARPGFGISTAFDVDRPGTAVLSYRDGPSRAWWIALQAIGWLALFGVAIGISSPFTAGRAGLVRDETLIDFDAEPTSFVPGEVLTNPGDTGPVERPPDAAPEPPFSDPEPGTGAATTDDDGADQPDSVVSPAASPRPALIVEPRRPNLPDTDDDSLSALVARVDDLDWDQVDRDLGLPPGGPS